MHTTGVASAHPESSPPSNSTRLAKKWSSRAPNKSVTAIVMLALTVYVLTAGGLIAIGYGISRGGPVASIDTMDRDLAAEVAERRTPGLNSASEAFDTLADTTAVIVVVAITVLLAALRRTWRRLLVMAVAIPLELLTYVSISFAVDRPRPDEAMGMLPITPSFPSGHAAMAVALYGSLAFMLTRVTSSRILMALAVVAASTIALSVAWARAYSALHYTSDVVFGLVLGAISLMTGIVATRVLDLRHPTP